MKNWLIAAVAGAAVFGMSAAFAADMRDVTVVNGTGYRIKFLGFNNPGDNEWSDNELSNPLANGDKVVVKFGTGDESCKWNFKIEWADPGYPGVVWNGVDLCSVEEITLKYDRASDTTTAETR